MDSIQNRKRALSRLEENYRARVRIEKAISDAKRLKERASRVLILDAEGNVKHILKRDPRGRRSVPIIAVLAPTDIDGVWVPETDVLEIGFWKRQPYRDARAFVQGVRQDYFYYRDRARELSSDEYGRMKTQLLETLRDLVLELRESWEHKEPWRVGKKDVPQERGTLFIVHRSDAVVHAHFLAEESRFRSTERRDRKAHYHLLAKRVQRRLSSYTKAYTDKQFAKLKWVNSLGSLLLEQHDPSLAVLELMRRVEPRYRNMLERTAKLYDVRLIDEEGEASLAGARKAAEVYAEGFFLCRIGRRKRSRQGKGCLYIEGFLDTPYREKHEVPF